MCDKCDKCESHLSHFFFYLGIFIGWLRSAVKDLYISIIDLEYGCGEDALCD